MDSNVDQPNPIENKLSPDSDEDEKRALQKRVEELEEKVAELESKKPQKRISWKEIGKKLPAVGLLVLTILLASIPAFLVIKDRWLENPFQPGVIEHWWYDLGLSEATSFRPYFLIIFCCILATTALVLIIRSRLQIYLPDDSVGSKLPVPTVGQKQRKIGKFILGTGVFLLLAIVTWTAFGTHIPGWDLLFALTVYSLGLFLIDNPLLSLLVYLKSRGASILAMVLSTFSLILFFESYYSNDGPVWGLIVLPIIAFVILLYYWKQIPVAFWIFITALFLFTLYINAWWFSVIGDDYGFYNYALELATRQPIGFIGEKLFNGQGVYGAHPQLSSIIQAFFIKLFGEGNFGWRIGNIFLSALSLVYFYSFFRIFIVNRLAVISVILLAGSEYLMTFGKIGYNNLQAFFILGLIFWAAGYATHRKSNWSFALLGLSVGLCFYVYPASLYTSILPLVLVAIYDRPTNKSALIRWGLLIISGLAIVFPLFFQPEYWSIKEAGTFFYNPEITKSMQSIFGHLSRNLAYALLSFLYIHEESHFIAVSYLDPISGALLIIGLVYAIKSWRASRFSKFWLASFALMVFLVGASHDRQFPPSTRMFLILPWFVFFAATGLAWIHSQATNFTRSRLVDAIFPLVIFLIIVTNIYQAYTISPIRLEQYQGIEALFLRIARQGERVEPQFTKQYVFVTQPDWGVDGLLMIQQVYDLPDSPLQIERVVVANENLTEMTGADKPSSIIPEDGLATLSQKDAIVFLQRYTAEEWKDEVEAALSDLGMIYCEARNFRGRVILRIWHHGLYNEICE